MSYMKVLDVLFGLGINFHEMKLTDGITRVIVPGANRTRKRIRNPQKETKNSSGYMSLDS
jgi:hypothetical protein